MKQNIVERTIMWGDLDSLGIVFYPRYYEWIDGCSHIFLDALGLNLGELWKERNILFGLVETSCRYSEPGKYHQAIQIITRIHQLEKKTLSLEHRIVRADEGSLMVTGFEKRICMNVADPENIRAVDIPEDIYEKLRIAT